MNEIFKDDQHKIGTAITLSYNRLEEIAAAATTFKAERGKISGYTEYTDKARQDMTNRAAAVYSATTEPKIAELLREAKTITEAMAEMENTLDTGIELQNALNVAKLAKSLPSTARFALFEQFRGQPQQLTILGAAFEAVEVDPLPYSEPLDFTAEKTARELEDAIYMVAAAPTGSTVEAWRLSRKLEELAQRVGADNARHAADLDGLDGGLDEAIRNAMGL